MNSLLLLTQLPWDWSNFKSSFKDGRIEFDENDIISKVNDDIIEFGKIKFRVKSVVYEKATIEDIIEGFRELNTLFDFVRVIEVLLKSMIIRTSGISNISEFEPEVVDFLKICYWYNRIKNIKTIQHRRKEIRSRLCKKLLYKLERDKRTIDYSNLTDEEIKKRIDDTLDEINKARSPQNRLHTFEGLNTYLNFINVCISELMFPALANESNFEIDFVRAHNDYDYDMMLNGHATQIKTSFSYDIFATNETGKHKQEAYRIQYNKLRDMYDKHEITHKYVEQEILKYIKNNCIYKINEALRQKSEIILLDATRTIPGLLLNYYYTNDFKFVKIYDSFVEAMKQPPYGFVKIIFASAVYDHCFRISSLVIKIPVVKVNQAKEMEKDKICILWLNNP